MESSPIASSYMRRIHASPRPTRAAEAGLAAGARRQDPDALETLALGHLAFVVHVAKEFRGRGVPLEDLVSEGCVGLMKAMKRYDPSGGTRFMTYAVFWIRKAILDALHEQPRVVRVPRYQREKGRAMPREVRLDEPLGGTELRLLDVLADDASPSPGAALIADEDRDRLRRAVLMLPARDQAVLAFRFGFVGERVQTLHEVGRRLAVSKERVRQIEASALARLRMAFRRGPDHASRGLRLAPSQM